MLTDYLGGWCVRFFYKYFYCEFCAYIYVAIILVGIFWMMIFIYIKEGLGQNFVDGRATTKELWSLNDIFFFFVCLGAVIAMKALKDSLRVPERMGWNGDPCAPTNWDAWEGVTCRMSKDSTALVISQMYALLPILQSY